MAERIQRLTRTQVIEGLRWHAKRHGYVSFTTLYEHDRVLLRSIALHFVGLDAARHAATVAGPPLISTGAKRGPKPGARFTQRRTRSWTFERVVTELRRLHRSGGSTRLDDLIESGRGALVHAATAYAGGLVAARIAAGVPQPVRQAATAKSPPLTRRDILRAIRLRVRSRQSIASTKVPQSLFRSARRQFGSWPAALDALGIDARGAREYRAVYTRDEISRRLRRAARAGSDLRAVSLRGVVDLKAIRRLFGTLALAISAAGLDAHLSRRKHGLQKWSQDRIIEVLRERAARGIHTLTSNLHNKVQTYFGGAEAARAAAGVPSPLDVRRDARRLDVKGRSRARAKLTQRRAGRAVL